MVSLRRAVRLLTYTSHLMHPALRDADDTNRWKEALIESARLGDRIVPRSVILLTTYCSGSLYASRVDLGSTALDALRTVKMDDLQRFSVTRDQSRNQS
jgi:hypothetical protein